MFDSLKEWLFKRNEFP